VLEVASFLRPECTRVVIADDEPLVRRSLRTILGAHSDLAVVGEADGAGGATELAIRLRPDVLLLDIRMPDGDGLETLRRLREAGLLEGDGLRVLILTTFDLDEYVDEALALGAAGFLVKTARYEELVAAVRAVEAGGAPLAPSVARRVVAHYRRAVLFEGEALRRLAVLTDRERDVLAVLANGRSNAEIAADLHVSVHTVKSHISSLLAKLGLRDRAQVVALACQARVGGTVGTPADER